MMAPRPPNSDVPPITTAVMLSRFAVAKLVGLTDPTRPQLGPGDAAMQDAADAGAVVSERLIAPLGDRLVPTVQVVLQEEEPPVSHVDRVIAHIGELKSHVGDRQTQLGQGHVFAVHESDAGAPVSL